MEANQTKRGRPLTKWNIQTSSYTEETIRTSIDTTVYVEEI